MLNKKALTGTASAAPLFVDELFSTYLYTGNGSTQTITNGIDLAGEGGLTWIKIRNDADNHFLTDTVRGATKVIRSNQTNAEGTEANALTAFTGSGFTLGNDTAVNRNTYTYASWTFRKAPKFFDVVTYTGNGNASKTISHNLGSTPGMVIVKKTSATSNWIVWAKVSGTDKNLRLNTTGAATSDNWIYSVTSTQFVAAYDFGSGAADSMNDSGATYVAYLFAHDAGGFGDAGTDNIISCGSFTADGSGAATVTLGYEPQYLLYKRSDSTGSWKIADNMRGISDTGSNGSLNLVNANASSAEYTENGPKLTPTGFSSASEFIASATYIYMAIRRPMKTPTSGTEVFNTDTFRSTTANPNFKFGFVTDMTFNRVKNDVQDWGLGSRLTGTDLLQTASTAAAITSSSYVWDYMNGRGNSTSAANSQNFGWGFKRATGFFDVVCYTGTGSNRTVAHNLGVAPEFMIVKSRSNARNWVCYHSATGNTKEITLNTSNVAATAASAWNNTSPTSTEFTVGTDLSTNGSGYTFVAYLFASLDGISKVGSYTGNGSSQTINCGFSAGARFVLIRRTDSSGDWCVFDTARGIVSGNDPFLQLNSTAAEVTNEDAVDPDNSGFIVNQTTASMNVNNATYIYLAIA